MNQLIVQSFRMLDLAPSTSYVTQPISRGSENSVTCNDDVQMYMVCIQFEGHSISSYLSTFSFYTCICLLRLE